MYTFSKDWFSYHTKNWQRILEKRYKGVEGVKALEVGTFEGRSALWLVDNILTGQNSAMHCVDNFSRVSGGEGEKSRKVLMANISKCPQKQKIKVFRGDSGDVLKKAPVCNNEYDIIYIDANHHSRHVLEDAVLAFALLKKGGVMIFDDNTDSKEHDNTCPKPAINAFLMCYANDIKVLHSGWQVFIQKREKPLRTRSCRSEL